MKNKTLVFGATPNPDRYAYKAFTMLENHGYEAVGVGVKKGEINGKAILPGTPELDNIHTITLYVNPGIQAEYYSYFLSLKPSRIIFNPGTENDELEQICHQHGIEPVEACTLVMLSTGQY